MGDFFNPSPGNSGGNIPEPDIPAPDFQTIGAQLGAGFTSTVSGGGVFNGLLQVLLSWVTGVLAWLIAGMFKIFTFVISVFGQVDEKAEPAFAQLAAATIQNLFDVPVNAPDVGGRGQYAQRQALAQSMGKAILDAIFSGAQPTGQAGLQPGSAAAEAFLWRVTHLGLEGWFEALISDSATYHVLEKYGDLKDIMERMLGLGRLSHRILMPALKVLIQDPWLWQLNLTYRPTLLPVNTAVRQFIRGKLTRDQLNDVLGRWGYSAANIDALINENTKFLADADISYLMKRGTFQQADAKAYLQQQGWDATSADSITFLMQDQVIDPYRRSMAQAAEAAFVRRDIDLATFQQILQSADLPQVEQDWIVKAAQVKQQLNVKHLSIGEVQLMIRKGLMNFTDLQQWAQREGYPAEEETFLELLTQEEINTATAAAQAKAAAAEAKAKAAEAKAAAAQQKAAAAAERLQFKGVSMAEAQQLVKDGQWTFDQYTAFLTGNGVAADHIPELVNLLHEQIDAAQQKAQAAAEHKAAAAVKQIPLATMEKGVKDGVLSLAEFESTLTSHGYTADEVSTLVAVLQADLQAAATKTAAKTAATAKAKAKSITLPEIERAARLGLATVDQYRAALTAAGEDAASIDLLVAMLQQQIASDQAAATKRKDAALKAGQAGVSLAQLEQSVIAGVRPIADYSAQLSLLGYDQGDITTLTDLLQTRVDHQAAVASKQKLAEEHAAATGLSLGTIGTATKLGVLTIDQYTALLAKMGISAADQAILRASMLAEIAKAAKTATKATAAAKATAGKKPSLGQVEAEVLAGLATVDDYVVAAIAAGYGQADAAELGQLVQLKADNAKATAAAKAAAQAKAADKDPGLSKIEAMVKGGILTMDDYGSYLAEIGMDPVDVGLMQALLQQTMDAAAAKAAAKAAKSGTTTPAPAPATGG